MEVERICPVAAQHPTKIAADLANLWAALSLRVLGNRKFKRALQQ
jgi:hypothetical protein